MLAKDIMTREVLTVHPEERLDHVARLLVEQKISGVPVVDDMQHVVGIVSENDLMVKATDLKVPFYFTLFDSTIYLENPLKFQDTIKRYTAVKVKEIMTTKVVTVDEDTEVAAIVTLMQKKDVNRLPVLRHNKLVGIITRNDILKALVRVHE
ncbi:MAG: CBS domain-containing protein [Solirubrobacterales bacterium]